ncbi:hypothetical protein ACJJTC_016897 [Scirpophaga incertulas]
MLEEVVRDYAAYLKLDVTNGFQNIQEVIDNMLTRLEELDSVLQIIDTVDQVVLTLQNNVERLEQQVNKAEKDFGMSNDNTIKSLLKPFIKKSNENTNVLNVIDHPRKITFESIMDNFEEDHS